MKKLILIAIGIVVAVAFFTNPSAEFRHNEEVKETIEETLTPILADVAKEEVSTNSLLESIIVNLVADSQIGQNVVSATLQERLKIKEVKNYYVFSIGHTEQEWITIGAFGNVWTVFDFMPDSYLEDFVRGKYKELLEQAQN